MKYALIKNNKVVEEPRELTDEELQTIESSNQYQQVIDVTNDNPTPGIGWEFNGSKIVPPASATVNPSFVITKLAYRQRFTTAEMVALYVAKDTNPVLRMLIDNLSVATFIDLKRADTISGTMYLVQQGLLTYERSQVILTTVPTIYEIYKG